MCLSRAHPTTALQAITLSKPVWMKEITNSYSNDPKAQKLISQLLVSPSKTHNLSYQHEVPRYKSRLYIGTGSNVRSSVLSSLHSSAIGGHSGIQATYNMAKLHFYWPKMQQDIISMVTSCDVCQRNKHENTLPAGLLQPLPIPDQAWKHISMEFIEGLYKNEHKDVILLGTNLKLTTAYHPQTDGQTKRVNACLENYLRCMSGFEPKKWFSWMALAEWWYNTSYHTSIKMYPFKDLYGYDAPHLAFPTTITTYVVAVEEYLAHRNAMLDILKDSLFVAQARMIFFADQKRTERSFEVGDLVYLKLHPYRQASVSLRKNFKLSAKYYVTFPILDKVGNLAYKLQLPPEARVRPVFRVSQLKKKIGSIHVPSPTLPLVYHAGQVIIIPISVLICKTITRGDHTFHQVLIRWSNATAK
ncbi:uncharacterized protein LOC113286531 [Papaver somniferum]|uniref:uncharacterized protein LOC113286531 n=1 Tax=Papaver somniferum TaxID=3469 RepID=UPI000E6FEFF5|nr:uncharacterized protein LOC113286531 [Papaver somniferum]